MSHRCISAGPEEAAGAKPPSSARTRREERRRLEQQLMQEHAGFVEAQSNNTGLQRSASNRKQFLVGSEWVTAHNDEQLSVLRSRLKIPNNFLEGQVKWEKMDNFGGKGGQELVVSDDSQYVIKGLSAADHQQLELLCSRLATYVGTGPSLLAPFVLHFTRFFGGKESQFVVMKNVLPCDNYNAVFDLKGADDDDRIVSCEHHGTIERPSTWDSASSDVSTQFCAHQALARQARFSVTPTQHSYLMDLISRDSRFLETMNVMDYSLLLGVQYGSCVPSSAELSGSTLVALVDGELTRYDISIIDFLQDWNAMKKAAHVIKFHIENKATEPPDKYQERFVEVLRNKFVSDAQEIGQEEMVRTALVHDLLRVASM